MSIAGAPESALNATVLLAFDANKLAQYLETSADANGSFDISGLFGVEDLSDNQRTKLAENLRDAASKLDDSTLAIDVLLTRLEGIAAKQNGSFDLPRSPPRSFDSTDEATPSPITIMDYEKSSYHELVQGGGHPVCSLNDLAFILNKPMIRYKPVVSWLSDHPDSEIGSGELKTLFSRQFTRWWDFRKSQWTNRGIIDDMAGFSDFFEASSRRYEAMGALGVVSAPSFRETIQRLWRQKPVSRQLPGEEFSVYRDAVENRLRSHRFTRNPDLKENPYQQTRWTDWLEYLNYEQWHLESLSSSVESLEERFYEAWRKLLQAQRHSSGNPMASNSTNSASVLTASRFTQTRQQYSAKDSDLAVELRAARSSIDAFNKTMNDFIRETEPYVNAQTAVYYQKHRVKWIIKEARTMEIETSMESKTIEKPKRKRRSNDCEVPKAHSKRAKQSDRRYGTPNTTLSTPSPRRSLRIAQGGLPQTRS